MKTQLSYIGLIGKLIFFILFFSHPVSNGQIQTNNLLTEYLKNPVGIDITHPRFYWKLYSEQQNQVQTAYQILVASTPALLTEKKADMWNSGKIESANSIHVEYAGKALQSRDACWWTVRVWDKNGKPSKWSKQAYFEMGLLSPEDWKAEWIKTSINFDEYSYPSPMFRKEFYIGKNVRKARVYISSLGLYEMKINGKRVGDYLLTPGFTSYDYRNQYQVYDVTSMLNIGNNAIGIILGNGWYRNFNLNRGNMAEKKLQDLMLIFQLEIVYDNGIKEIVCTDSDWKSATGPILMTSIYDGETYDARLDKEGWTSAEFNDNIWQGVEVVKRGKETLVATNNEPVRRIKEIKPVKVIYTPEGDTVLDMGQNMVGWCRLRVNCPRGTTITLRHGEVLDKLGNFYTESLRTAKQTISYTCKGGGVEVYEPRFTFQGFRYVAVSGFPDNVMPEMVTGIVVHSDTESNGHFNSSDSLLNRLYSNISWVQRCNMVDVATDCPQRDERCGWGGDLQLFAPTAIYNRFMASFYTKWLKDLNVEQEANGFIPCTVPFRMGPVFPVTGWSDAATIIPWLLYRRYGDTRILKEQYQRMKDWVEYMRRNSEKGERFEWSQNIQYYGDWLAFKSDGPRGRRYAGSYTDTDLLATLYFYHSTGIVQKSALVLGNEKDALEYLALQDKISNFFLREYVTSTGRISPNTQTAYALALSFGILKEDLTEAASNKLVENIRNVGHITTGLMGTAEICHALSDHGLIEEAYRLLLCKDYPSWLFMVRMGGTTIWERWDSMRPDSTFQLPHMNSFNHPALGSIGNWLYTTVAGINTDPEIPGFKSIVIKPFPGGTLRSVEASYKSLYGNIRSEWKIEENRFKLTVEIPVNTTATIFLPSTGDGVILNGKPLTKADKEEPKNLPYYFQIVEIGSGAYEFESTYVLN